MKYLTLLKNTYARRRGGSFLDHTFYTYSACCSNINERHNHEEDVGFKVMINKL